MIKTVIAVAATSLAAAAFAQVESQPTDKRIYDNTRIPHQAESSEGWIGNAEQGAAIGQGRPRVHDGVVSNPVYVSPTMSSDDRIVYDVSSALANDPTLRGAYLNVDSVGGEVRITGTVQDYAQANLVRRTAESVVGPGRVMTSLAPR